MASSCYKETKSGATVYITRMKCGKPEAGRKRQLRGGVGDNVDDLRKHVLGGLMAIRASEDDNTLLKNLEKFHKLISDVPLDDLDLVEPLNYLWGRLSVSLSSGDVSLKCLSAITLTDLICNSELIAAKITPEIAGVVAGHCCKESGASLLDLLELLHWMLECGNKEVRDSVVSVISVDALVTLAEGNSEICAEVFRVFFSLVRFDGIDPSSIIEFCRKNMHNEQYFEVVLECLSRLVTWYREKPINFVNFDSLLDSSDVNVVQSALQFMTVMTSNGLPVHVTPAKIVHLMIGERPDDILFHAALALHKLVESDSTVTSTVIDSRDLVRFLMESLSQFPMRVRFHVAWVLLFCASKITEVRQLIGFIPKDQPITFASIAKDILDMENEFLTDMFLIAWDNIFTVSSHIPFIKSVFLEQFPGESIWEYFSFSNAELDEKAEKFLSTWFHVET